MHPIQTAKDTIIWLAKAWSEKDDNGGKASFSRIAGTFVIINIVFMAWEKEVIPQALMTLFWVLIGYQMVSKILNSLSPAVLDIAKSWLLKAGVVIKDEPKS